MCPSDRDPARRDRGGNVAAVSWRLIVLVGLIGSTAACGGAPGAPTAASTAAPQPGSSTPAATAPAATVPVETTTSLPPPMPVPSPPLTSPGDNRVYVLGDSVILGAQYDVPKALTGWKVTFDAHESRLVNHGLGVLKARKAEYEALQTLAHADLEQAYRDAGLLPPKPPPPPSVPDVLGRVVVVHLCTNYLAGGGFATYIDQFMAWLAGVERVVWVTCAEWSPGQVEANDAIRAAPARHPTAVVADWARFSPTPDYTYDDNIHLTESGRASMAELVARAVGPAPAPLPPTTTTTRPKPTSTTTTSTTAPPPATEAPIE